MQNVSPDELKAPGDSAWDSETFKRRVAKYFRSAAKGLSFGGDFRKVINEYADLALGNVSWALQGTKWLPKADFTLVLEVAIGELFPENFRANIPEEASFEETILQAHDRALEEARFSPILMDTVKEVIDGKKACNKVYNAAEAARKNIVEKMLENQDDSSDFFHATEHGVMEKIQDFVKDWITSTFKQLGDWPEGVLEQKDAQRLFDKLMSNEECCLPRSLVRYMVEPLPEPWDFVAEIIKDIYAASAAANAEFQGTKKRKRDKDEGPNFLYKTEWCRNIANTGFCKMGDWCVFAHHEYEMHKGGPKGMKKGGKEPGLDMGFGKGFGKGPACFGPGPKGCGYGMEFGDEKGFFKGKDPYGKGPYGKGPPHGGGAFGTQKGKGGFSKSAKGGPRPSSAPSYPSSPFNRKGKYGKGKRDEGGDDDGLADEEEAYGEEMDAPEEEEGLEEGEDAGYDPDAEFGDEGYEPEPAPPPRRGRKGYGKGY